MKLSSTGCGCYLTETTKESLYNLSGIQGALYIYHINTYNSTTYYYTNNLPGDPYFNISGS